MTLSTPLLAAVPLLAGLIGPALLGAVPGRQQAERPAVASAHGLAHRAERSDIVEHVAARTVADQRRVLDYWTPERMAKALPIGLLDVVTGERGLTGQVARLLPDLSGGRSDLAVPRELMGSNRLTGARPDTSTAGSRWMTGGLVSRTTGRVFLTVSGADFVCSASTIKSANRDVVVTAGHCVKDGAGAWAANWTFVPGYGTAGTHPFGKYTARRMFVASPWSRSGDDNYDVGMVVLNTSRGRHVADVVGAQDIAFNGSRGGQVFGFGYPADPPYDGTRLVYCAGRLRADPHRQTRDQGLGCAMTAGSSGGPWMTRFDPATGRGTITSVSSFKYSDDRRTMYGPYFGDAVKTLYNTAQRA
ncbi:trypsin-like serine peptidase [Nonomuraea aridisoli]|uniref:trypsin-like serine peptidase n=1 Tax=Nonomuraea aridisoli TaxID=2070368 RepID=UPI0015E8A812|nr:trypsin-like serine protease [Nonomuraea aridisoli]